MNGASHIASVVSILLLSKKRTALTCLTADDEYIRVVVDGDMGSVQLGEMLRLRGDWEIHSSYGRQLRCKFCDAVSLLPTGRLIIPFLAQNIPGVGERRAARLLAAFGDGIAEVIEDQSKLFEIASAITPNLSSFALVLAAQIQHVWPQIKAEYETFRWLESQGVQDRSAAKKIVSLLGVKTRATLEINPYVLVGCLSWAQVDKIGCVVQRGNLAAKEMSIRPQRLVGALDCVVLEMIRKGHTAIPKNELPQLLARKLGVSESSNLVDRAILLGISNNAVRDHLDLWRAPGAAYLEDDLARMLGQKRSGDCTIVVPADLRSAVTARLAETGTTLFPEQFEAVTAVLTRPIALLIGGAGTGKTTTTKAICDMWEGFGGQVLIAALAGKAALRSQQATGRIALTLFRLMKHLERGPSSERNYDAHQMGLDLDDELTPTDVPDEDLMPRLTSTTLLIIDEASMVDLGQWHQLVSKMPIGCRLLMVGDPGQLSPIGFGIVFHLLASNPSLTFTLRDVRRQSGNSIPQVSRQLLEGFLPNFGEYTPGDEGVHFIQTDSSANCMPILQDVVADLGGFKPFEFDIMIIAALNNHRNPNCPSVTNINRLFGGFDRCGVNLALNDADYVDGYFGEYFAVGDPVIHNRNDYKLGLRNGSLGHVIHVNPKTRELQVLFDSGIEVRFNRSNLIDINLAYGITCHKSQGSEAPNVIVMLSESGLCDPSWLYTAVTRAKNRCVIIGTREQLAIVLSRPLNWTSRKVCFPPDIHGL